MFPHRKGQVQSIDLMLAIFVFSVLVAFFMGYWGQQVGAAKAGFSKNKLEYSAISATDLMVKSQGRPADWEKNASGIQMLGLANYPYVLSSAKLSNFTNLSYSAAKTMIGTTADFYWYVEDTSGNRLYEAGNSSVQSNVKVSIMRDAMLNGQAVRMRLTLYG